MQIFRYAEEGSLRLLWISGTNPAVSLPDLPRVRRIFRKRSLFTVVNDAFLTETAELADVVLPAAMWGEKTGTFTNADRTVHLSEKAIDPPGEAKSDLDIFVDYARRMGFRDKDGDPLVSWSDAHGAFRAFQQLTAGRPCDYTGISYSKLAQGSGIQWPCNASAPEGTERLYTDGVFNTSADACELYGHDLETGAALTEEEYRAHDPRGRARLKAAEYAPPHEVPDAAFPFWLTTGRVVYHWHTRTKTGRSEALAAAAGDAFVEITPGDAQRLGVRPGELLQIETRRGGVRVQARIADGQDGCLFLPFHYGYWDEPGRPRAANELTLTTWDPVSKQPSFKYAAARVRKISP
jgi:ferredoxin-nitrate reductase